MTKEKASNLWAGLVACATFTQAVGAATVGFKVESDRPSAHYACGEEAVLKVTATNGCGEAVREGSVNWTLDNFTSEGTVARGVWNLADENPRIFRGTLAKPDFLRLLITGERVNNLSAWTRHQFWWGVAFEPEKIRPGGANPADFDAFWSNAVAKLEREVPLDPRVTRVAGRSTKEYDFYRISFATVGGRRVHGFMSVPTDKGRAPYPVIFEVSSAGEGLWTMDMSHGLPDRIRVYFTVHNFEPPKTVDELVKIHRKMGGEMMRKYGTDYASYGLAWSREDYYFYDKILGINRAANWVWAREDVDKRNFGYIGGSQGGGFGLYLTGLNRHFTSAVLHVPALCDTLGYQGGHASGWPHLIERTPADKKEAAARNAPYFDGANFARRVTCPIRMSVGFVDTACNPASVYAAFNVCPSRDKKISDGIGMGHFGQTAVLDRVNDLWQRNLPRAADPVTKPAYRVLPMGANTPDGWLRVQFEQLRDGLTGHAEELYGDIGSSDWLTGGKKGGEHAWERGPYYAKGLVAMALAMNDEGLRQKARRWIEAFLASQRENGDFGPRNDNWWANMIVLHAMRDWAEATGDERALRFLERYFRYQLSRLKEHRLGNDSHWAVVRAGDNLEVVLWLYDRTKEAWLVQLAEMLVDQGQGELWARFYAVGGGDDLGLQLQHIVNFMQGLKFPALKNRVATRRSAAGATAYDTAFAADGWAMLQHGRIDRMVNGTEFLSGRESCKGTELCATAERILSCRDVISATGNLNAADDMEVVAYNTLPSALGDDGRGMRYYQILNLPRCITKMNYCFVNNGSGNALTPGPDAGFGCCRSNFHMAWPKFVQSMWFETADGDGLLAAAYGPCTLTHRLATIVQSGDYPFGDRVTMKVTKACGDEWELRFRVPVGCQRACVGVRLNGKPVACPGDALRRRWTAGDELELTFPARLMTEKGVYDAMAIRRGALVYALKLDAEITALPVKAKREGFPVREYRAKDRFGYVLKVGADGQPETTFVPPTDLTGNVFRHGASPCSLKVTAYRTDYAGWGYYRAPDDRAIEPVSSPVRADHHAATCESLTFVPMGATQVRMTLFPWTK